MFGGLAGVGCWPSLCMAYGRTLNPGDVMLTVTAHEASEWARMAQDAYRNGHNFYGHRYSAAAATLAGKQVNTEVYDTLQRHYRTWLIWGWADLV